MVSMKEQIVLGAIRFQFLPDERGWCFDSIPFYTDYIKDFLIVNEGDAVWIKGGVVERKAYLMFKSSIEKDVIGLITRSINTLTRIKITPMENPYMLFDECLRKKRVFIGYLELGSQKIGESKKPIIKVKMRDNYCFICPYVENGKCTLEGYHGDCIIDIPFLMDGNYGLIAGNLKSCERIKVVI
jgi:hypothetical protein